MSVIVCGQDDATLNQAILEHFNPGKMLNLRIESPKPLSRADLDHISKLLENKGVNILRFEFANTPYPNTLNIIFVRPSLKQGYRSNWEPVKVLSSYLDPLQNWELTEA